MIELSGRRFDKLTVLSRVLDRGPQSYWNCVCDCGKNKVIRGDNLLRGSTRSCGCSFIEFLSTHSGSGTREYNIWCHVRARCLRPTNKAYKRYGGRGIKVCDRWLDFANFRADMGPCPPGHSIERLDCNGNYEPSNCKWIPRKDQPLNRRNRVFVYYQGQRRLLTDLAREHGMRIDTVHSRVVSYGWSVEKALTAPIKDAWRNRPRKNIKKHEPSD